MNCRKFRFILLILLIFMSYSAANLYAVKADTTGKATLRIIATGDLHGQVTAYNYETQLRASGKGLSKLATLAEQKKNEAGANNTLLVDAGDFLFDYTTNYFYDNYRDSLQPILRAMSLMGYDYITLGNHEFDYPLDYLSSQLDRTGLADKVLVCNTIWHDSGKQVFSPSAITTKYLSTSKGDLIPVRIGIIGSTTNIISSRRDSYINKIDVLDNYDCIVAEADRLKKKEKVDAVIVILHGGIGTENPGKSSDNIGYALTLVDSIDAVVAGHTHIIFPEEMKIKALEIPLSTVDIKTGCINGKPLVEASSHADALGTIDLTFDISSEGTVSVSGGKSHIDYVTDSMKENSSITDMFSDYKKKLLAGADFNTYSIAKGITYNNYDTLLQDSNLYQLLNNAKIAYGMTYVSENLPEYKQVPVIACTRNLLDSKDFYLQFEDTLSAEKISRILSESATTRPSGYIKIIEISGKALREWLEYNASMYAVQGTVFKNILKSYSIKNPGISTLLKEDYVYNQNSQYIFDGISYMVDLSKKARYTSAGVRQSSKNKRITSLTYNGTEITDTQKFVLVTDNGIPTLSFLPGEEEASIKEIRDNETGKNITVNYIKKMSAFGNISVKADHSWSLTAGKGYTFIFGVPTSISGTVSAYSWNKGLAAKTASYSFYKGSLPTVSQTINIIAAQGRLELNNEPVPVIISAASKYAIKEIKYLQGTVKSTTDSSWNNATSVKNNAFTTSTNGVYSIRVTDKNNKSSIAYITVDRYAADVLPDPVLNNLTNRLTTFTGKAVPNSTIYVTIGANKYSGSVRSDGTFSITVKPQKAFSQITAYAEEAGKKSAEVTASVLKTGPDSVQINTIKIGDTYVTGTADPYTFVYAQIWPSVYVGRGQTEAYKNSDFYSGKYNIIETDISTDQETGAYRIPVPALSSKNKIYVFSVNRFGETSKSTMLTPVY